MSRQFYRAHSSLEFLSLLLAECERTRTWTDTRRRGKAIFNAGRELSCRSSLYPTYPPLLNSLPAFPSSRLATFAFVLGGFNNRLTAITISRGPPQLNYAESIVSQRFAFSSYQPLCIFLVFCIFPICDPPPCCLSSPLEGVVNRE